MAFLTPVTLSHDGVTLAPLELDHEAGLAAAAADGELWTLRVTSAPAPGETRSYIEQARATEDRMPFVVLDATGTVVGTTSYHDILPGPRRLEIGWTWYAKRVQRTHVNTTCKLLLLRHAFATVGCQTVGWRTDGLNRASQQAIERLGARKDGVIRGHRQRRDGTIGDTVMYSVVAAEWPAVQERLEGFLRRGSRESRG